MDGRESVLPVILQEHGSMQRIGRVSGGFVGFATVVEI